MIQEKIIEMNHFSKNWAHALSTPNSYSVPFFLLGAAVWDLKKSAQGLRNTILHVM